jgi:threonine/homoserine/homoserine lactone efflux protein
MTELLAGYVVALVLAAQVGPITLLIVRSVVRGGRAVAVGIAMAAAVAGVDLGYATLGLAGAGRLLQVGGLQLALGLSSGAVLIWIGARTIWFALRARSELALADRVQPRRAFQTAIVATALNPLTIALWTLSFPAAAPASASRSLPAAVAVLVGAALGTLTWYCGFALLIAGFRQRVGQALLKAVDLGTGSVLIGFGGLLGYRSLQEH